MSRRFDSIAERFSEYERMEYRPIPLAPNTKVPPQGFPLAAYFSGNATAAEARRWFAADMNVGLLTDKLIVVDFDIKQFAREFLERYAAVLKTIVETARGMHFYFQSPCSGFSTQKLEHGDLKAGRGYVVAPPSVVDGWTYRFLENHGPVPLAELPVITADMLTMAKVGKGPITRKPVEHAVRYVMSIDSVQGQHGSHGLVRAISILLDAGLTEAEATVVMLDWNKSGKANPPWPLNQLTRAISRTFAKHRTAGEVT